MHLWGKCQKWIEEGQQWIRGCGIFALKFYETLESFQNNSKNDFLENRLYLAQKLSDRVNLLTRHPVLLWNELHVNYHFSISILITKISEKIKFFGAVCAPLKLSWFTSALIIFGIENSRREKSGAVLLFESISAAAADAVRCQG